MSGEAIQKVVKRPRPNINDAIRIHTDDDADVWVLRKQSRAPCPKCTGEKWHYHDIYVEVIDGPITTFKFYRICRDCQHEGEISINSINESVEKKITVFQNDPKR